MSLSEDVFRYSGPNRTVCDCLREMRECFKTHNFAPIPGLIEEVQSMVNRMEAALYDQKDLEAARKKLQELKKEAKNQDSK